MVLQQACIRVRLNCIPLLLKVRRTEYDAHASEGLAGIVLSGNGNVRGDDGGDGADLNCGGG